FRPTKENKSSESIDRITFCFITRSPHLFLQTFVDESGQCVDLLILEIQLRHLRGFDAGISKKPLEVVRRKPLCGEIQFRVGTAFGVHLQMTMATDAAFRREQADSPSGGRESSGN